MAWQAGERRVRRRVPQAGAAGQLSAGTPAGDHSQPAAACRRAPVRRAPAWSGTRGGLVTRTAAAGKTGGFAEPVVSLRIADRSEVHRPLRARRWRHTEAGGLPPRRQLPAPPGHARPYRSRSWPLAEASPTPVTPSRSSSPADPPASATPGTGTLPGLASTVRQSTHGRGASKCPAIAPGSGAREYSCPPGQPATRSAGMRAQMNRRKRTFRDETRVPSLLSPRNGRVPGGCYVTSRPAETHRPQVPGDRPVRPDGGPAGRRERGYRRMGSVRGRVEPPRA